MMAPYDRYMPVDYIKGMQRLCNLKN